MKKRHINTIITVKALILAVVLLIFLSSQLKKDLRNRATPDSSEIAVSADSAVEIGGDFNLRDTKGRIVNIKKLGNKPMLIYFGYTHCPDACPTSLTTMQNVHKQLGAKSNDIAMLFITIDPDRDRPKILDSYMSDYPNILALTGTKKQIADAAKKYKIYYSSAAHDHNSADLMDHSTFIYFISGNGKYIAHFTYNYQDREITKVIEQYLQTK